MGTENILSKTRLTTLEPGRMIKSQGMASKLTQTATDMRECGLMTNAMVKQNSHGKPVLNI